MLPLLGSERENRLFGHLLSSDAPAILIISLGQSTSSRIKEYIESRLKIVKPGTVNRELALLHRAFQLAYNQDPPLVARVPHFPKLTEDEPRKGFLKPESYQKLLFELSEELRLLFVVAYHVGLRKGALLRIKWSQVDLPAQTIWMKGRRSNRKPEPLAVPNLWRHGQVHRNATAKQRLFVCARNKTHQRLSTGLGVGLPAGWASRVAIP
jgi:integrase